MKPKLSKFHEAKTRKIEAVIKGRVVFQKTEIKEGVCQGVCVAGEQGRGVV